MSDILHDIILKKREDLADRETRLPLTRLIDTYQRLHAESDLPTVVSMRHALETSPTGIIAEFKRRSPSKGWINAEAEAHHVPVGYAQAGAAALSILTDEPFFGGRLAFLRTAYGTVQGHNLHTPILRKDFIIADRQLYEARLFGASAVLLIAACLPEEEYHRLLTLAHQLDLEVLLEIHSEDELCYTRSEADMIGVNNRSLGSFHTNVDTAFRLAPLLPQNRTLVAESGLHSTEVVAHLRDVGYRGFLIGETFMRSSNPPAALAEFLQQLQAQTVS